jgi:putative membrane protein
VHAIVIGVALAIGAAVYARGIAMLWRRAHGAVLRRSTLFFAGGWITLAFALLSPLDEWAEQLFSVHMIQHELLMAVAAPLFVLAHPVPTMLCALPMRWRRTVGGVTRRATVRGAWRAATAPFVAWVIQGIVIWGWHIPSLFQATLRSEPTHALQHLSFLGSAMLFWWSVVRVRTRSRRGAAILYLFATVVHTSVLGALLTFSRTPWYPAYAHSAGGWGLSLLADQQLAGLIMWIPAGAVYLAAALAVVRRSLRDSEWAVGERERAMVVAAS